MDQITSSSAGDFGRLSDEVILMILHHLCSTDLYKLMKTCRRLHNLCQTEALWISILDPPDKRESLEFAVSNLINSRTKRVRLSVGLNPHNKGYRTSLSPSSLEILLQNQQLNELHLVNQKLDANYFRLHDLPPNLSVLNMSGCVLSNLNKHVQYLKDLGLKLQELEDLNLSHCSFVTAHSLMAISKLPKLTKLSLKGCRKIGQCLAYVALSSRFGFLKLKVLDVTDTRVGSTEFGSFAGLPSLEEFYFGQYDPFFDYPNNYITDLCLTRIRCSPTLKRLDLSGTRVTDRCLEVLQSIPKLERVVAHFTCFSKKGIESFHLCRPNCRILMVENPVQVPIQEPANYQDEDGDIEYLEAAIIPGNHQGQVGAPPVVGGGEGAVIIIDINRNAENNNNHNL